MSHHRIPGRAAVLESLDTPLVIADVEFGPLVVDEVLIRVVGVGICHTDLALSTAPFRYRFRPCSDTRPRAWWPRPARGLRPGAG